MWGHVRYECGALILTSFLCHFTLFSDALLWVSVQDITLFTSTSNFFMHLGYDQSTGNLNVCIMRMLKLHNTV